ncbi:nucleoid-associated protein, partial [Clostridium botulinum]|nr:nucleoid-associated protein [Clostridium botulinum]
QGTNSVRESVQDYLNGIDDDFISLSKKLARQLFVIMQMDENIKKEDQINDIYDFEDGKLLSNKGYARIRTVTDNINNKVVY